MTIISCLLAFLFSAIVTWIVRAYAIRKAILDIPNERSSHQIPTPRGGGIAIVLTFNLSLLWLSYIGYIEPTLFWALLGGGIAIAILGYCDDLYSIKARSRILIHFLVASWALWCLGGLPTAFPWIGYLLALIGIVWCINFYNFMDGIDGLAGSEGVFASVASCIALSWIGEHYLATIMWLLAASIAGFTVWNWPPAKIFLGDAGSGFLGFIFATFGLYTVNQQLLSISFWWLLSAVFFCDATFTLLYRMYQGKRWYSAHREHAYQDLVSYGAHHKQVTVSILIINCCLLFPAALATLYWPTKSSWLIGSSMMGLWLIWVGIKWRRSLLFL